MTEFCPESQAIAAHVEGRLAAEESDRLLDHCADCDECRRELAVTSLSHSGTIPSAPVPVDLHGRAKRAVLAAAHAQSCPDSEAIAAHAECRLGADESAWLLSHCADCEDCRRELAIVGLSHAGAVPASRVPMELHARAKRAVAGMVEGRSGSRRIRVIRPTHSSLAPFATAAAVLLAAVALLLFLYNRAHETDPSTAYEPTRHEPPKVVEPWDMPIPARRVEWPPVIQEEKPQPPSKTESAQPPKPDPLRPVPPIDSPRPPDETAQPDPKNEAPEPKNPETPVKPRDTVARKFAPVTLTDLSGEVYVRRKDKKEREKVSGVTVVSDGDVLMAEKLTAFFLLAEFPIALEPKTTLTVAFEKETNAPFLKLERGEALVDSTAGSGSRWLLSDGRVTVTLNKARAKFSAAVDGSSLAVTALTGSLSGEDDLGRPFALRAGEKVQVEAAHLAVKPEPAAVKKRDLMVASRPTEHTLWFWDGKAAPAEGVVDKDRTSKVENPILRSVEKKGVHTIRFVPKGATGHPDLLIRMRVFTNLKEIRFGLDIDERIQLGYDLKTRREQKGTWVTVEIPFEDLKVIGTGGRFMSYDPITSFTAAGRQLDAWSGDERGYIILDDIQIVERNP